MPVVFALVARCADGEPLAQHAPVAAARGLAQLALESWRTYRSDEAPSTPPTPSPGGAPDERPAPGQASTPSQPPGRGADGGLADERFTVLCDGLTFNFLVRSGFVFAVAADEAYGRGIPFACAQRVSDAWMARFGEAGHHSRPAVLQRAFG